MKRISVIKNRSVSELQIWSLRVELTFFDPISLTDYLSKYVISRAVPNDSATTAAEFLVNISPEFGPPHQLQTDCGTHFTSAIFEEIANRLGCVHTVSTPYHPQSQG